MRRIGSFSIRHLGRAVQPFPFVDAFAQDRAQHFERSVYSGIANALRELRVGDAVDRGAADGVQRLSPKMTIQPSQGASFVVMWLCD